MEYLEIPGAGRVSKLFLGTAWFEAARSDEIFDTLDAYIELGGNVIDTGRFYGGGQAEHVLREWLASRGFLDARPNLLIVNKACHHYVDEDNVHYPEPGRVNPECLTEDLEHSLENMKQKYFDIYLLHRDDLAEPVEGLIDRLEKHRREGKIKAWGVSNWTLPRIEAAMDYASRAGYRQMSVNSPSYSLATAGVPRWKGCVYAGDDYADWHREKGIVLLAWAPQAAGFFAEVYGESPPEDVRRTYYLPENLEKLQRSRVLAAERGVSPTNIALSYIFNRGLPVAASIGARSRAELNDTLRGLVRLSPDEVDWLGLRIDSRS